MDNRLVDYIAEEFKKEHGIDLRKDRVANQRLRDAAEKAKIELSTTLTTEIKPALHYSRCKRPKHLTMTMTRSKLEEVIRPVIDRCKAPMEQALSDGKFSRKTLRGHPCGRTYKDANNPEIRRGLCW